jgi:hypothetical protein
LFGFDHRVGHWLSLTALDNPQLDTTKG